MPEEECPTCNGIPGEPVRGNEDVFAFVPPMPDDAQSAPWSAMEGDQLAGARTELLPGIPAPAAEMARAPETPATHPAHDFPGMETTPPAPAQIHDNILDATPQTTVEYLPRLAAPWFEPGSVLLQQDADLHISKDPISDWADALKELAEAANAYGKAVQSGTEQEKRDAASALRDAQKKEAETRQKKEVFLAKLKKKKCCPDRIVCKVTYVHGLAEDYGVAWKSALLDVYAEWADAPPPCVCDCCVYRQYVKGYHTDGQGVKFGADRIHKLAPNVSLKEDEFQEDGGQLQDGSWVKWGHEMAGLASLEEYRPCSVKLRDFINARPADIGVYLTFKLRIEPSPDCEGEALEEIVTVTMKAGEEQPGTRIIPGVNDVSSRPPADWPPADARGCE